MPWNNTLCTHFQAAPRALEGLSFFFAQQIPRQNPASPRWLNLLEWLLLPWLRYHGHARKTNAYLVQKTVVTHPSPPPSFVGGFCWSGHQQLPGPSSRNHRFPFVQRPTSSSLGGLRKKGNKRTLKSDPNGKKGGGKVKTANWTAHVLIMLAGGVRRENTGWLAKHCNEETYRYTEQEGRKERRKITESTSQQPFRQCVAFGQWSASNCREKRNQTGPSCSWAPWEGGGRKRAAPVCWIKQRWQNRSSSPAPEMNERKEHTTAPKRLASWTTIFLKCWRRAALKFCIRTLFWLECKCAHKETVLLLNGWKQRCVCTLRVIEVWGNCFLFRCDGKENTVRYYAGQPANQSLNQ